jgi:hypothetical protein
MQRIAELHEQIDEVNYFVKEIQRLKLANRPEDEILQKPEVRFVSRALRHVIEDARQLHIQVILRPSPQPQDPVGRSTVQHEEAPMPDIPITEYHQVTTDNGDRLAYIGNRNSLLSLTYISEIIQDGGKLAVAGPHEGDWGM